MVSLRQQVFDIYDNSIIDKKIGINDIKPEDIYNIFPNAKQGVLASYLSEARSPSRALRTKPIKKINLDQIESRIIAIVNKSPNAQNMKLALDFIRLKQSTEGLQDEIDIEKYLKKVESITSCQEEVDT